MALNQLPSNLQDTTVAIRRRLLILPFKADFTGKKLDRDIGEKLEAEMSGIINRALHGLERLEKNNYIFSFEEQSNQMIDELFMDMNPLKCFVEDCIKNEPNSRLQYKEILSYYADWCKVNDVLNKYTIKGFSSALKQELRSKNIPINPFHSNGQRGLRNFNCTFKK